MNFGVTNSNSAYGEFIDLAGERYYAIRNVDKMAPFLVSVVSHDDHWLFASSTGGLTVGRVSPETALFPYVTVDKIHESLAHSGSKTMLLARAGSEQHYWEPFNRAHDGLYAITRNLYKNLLGNKLCYEEVNHDLQLAFRYTWVMSSRYGFARQCELQNISSRSASIGLVDGLQNFLPAGTPAITQTNTSNLVDAYKWTELDEQTGLALFTLYSGITDRAEPCESLKANTVFCLGLEEQIVLLSSQQLAAFRLGTPMQQEVHKRGIRGAYLVSVPLELAPLASQQWQIVANAEQSQAQVVELRRQLANPAELGKAIKSSVDKGSDELARIVANCDGFQVTTEENVSVHHYANVLFNVLRGGLFDHQYKVSSRDFAATIRSFNRDVYERNRTLLGDLPDNLNITQVLSAINGQGDLQLTRLCHEYLPITFGRRHGDPSRPWNQFTIKLKDEYGNGLLSYQGNWRDIFQNWEALLFSYPGFVESVIAKFVNASTMDGYNPYRITKEGIDWEEEEPNNPWSYIGYWGDHQIIYLQKLLELSRDFHPHRLRDLLRQPIYCYANVPYRIAQFEALLENPKSTVSFDAVLARRIEDRVESMGADGKLVLDANGDVYQVNLLEKLLVPLLCKLGNFVIDGGIWLNTQRPEWNDANNALVGHGLSMVTLYYMRRYVRFLLELLQNESGSFSLSSEVGRWLADTGAALRNTRALLGGGPISDQQRFASLAELGQAASRYRGSVYELNSFSGTMDQPVEPIHLMLDDALAAIDHSIFTNRRDDGLYQAYNLIELHQDSLQVDSLYPMLEGQVAALSAGTIAAEEAVIVLEALFASDIYRHDQRSFMLYPDRELPGFLAKNRIDAMQVETIPLLKRMLAEGDERIVVRDAEGCYRFSAEFTNLCDLDAEMDRVADVYGEELESGREAMRLLYESVFRHRSFTGRSGTMFGFEGLGSIYWHMVSKLMLAIVENFFAALESDTDVATCRRLGQLYYRVREGIGFNKTPEEYGAFPTDPYSHTPKHAGARQPGMTGQVKEEILCRFSELGVRVSDGVVRFQPNLLRAREFIADSRKLRFLDVDGNWQELIVPPRGLAFTWCQTPVIYELNDNAEPGLTIIKHNGDAQSVAQLALSAEESSELFLRSGHIRQLKVTFGASMLFVE